ncbi:helix-turn-helix domain-containing protein [Pseudoclavibacter sp. AY1H1]|uniref:helix-turn-helix domain-containing protein n=1 Tax=Pseudoclavibacter sp. AY1H1 TaxID=2080584 RepID=UPI0035BE7DD7
MLSAAESLSAALEESGMTRADLARALGVSPAEITHRLQGERNITVRTLAATAHYLGRRIRIELEPPSNEGSRSHERAAESGYRRWSAPKGSSTKFGEETGLARLRPHGLVNH